MGLHTLGDRVEDDIERPCQHRDQHVQHQHDSEEKKGEHKRPSEKSGAVTFEGIFVHDAVTGEDFSIPALSSKVVDRVGAGDAFLAFSAASMLQHNQPYLATFIGAAAAALEVQIVCNREPVNLGALTSYINTLLK